MAIEIVYEAKELNEEGSWRQVTREFTTEDPAVRNIVPQEDKVAIHLDGQTLLIPFVRVYELHIDLDEKTMEKMEKSKADSE